ncbi:hypothetical protein PN498_25180 [Oscillatoria sp. CS-180]|uniref:hypothetical protein n=1 Tax=Oscillatoria sp. CS-180 TaxID=3021720 RepID=UPI00232B4E5A|nr:hypothetical protein [Oscillatoria sp. CS-180]MDB9529310.1 hypothetical protein [Oscillatoria sp. CS-180]
MKQGDLVRFKQPFAPIVTSPQFYSFGVVIDVVSEGLSTEVLVYLRDLDGETIYVDETGAQAIYSFQMDEIECMGDRPSD